MCVSVLLALLSAVHGMQEIVHNAAAAPSCTCDHSSCLVSFTPPTGMDLHYVQLSPSSSSVRPLALITTTAFPLNVNRLMPSTTYAIAVRSHPRSAPSIAWAPSWQEASPSVLCTTTAAPAPPPASPAPPSPAPPPSSSSTSRFLRAYRVSEYAFDADFLSNHDAASADAMPLYLMTCSPQGNCAPWSTKDHTTRWDGCQRALASLCPGQRGAGFACIDCAEAHRAAVEGACGPWSRNDTLDGEGSFGVHWHCGVGWPESTAEEGPIAEYCVEYEPLPPKAEDSSEPLPPASREARAHAGFSEYLSCNSDEVDGMVAHYGPRDPTCICICLDDRLLGHQTLSQLNRSCFHSGTIPWVDEPQCVCEGTDSEVPKPGNPSLTHVGRAPIYLPYVGNELKPLEHYPVSILGGFNYHFPRDGECAEGQPLGTAGCTWRRLPSVRLLYGADLLGAGWNRTFVADTPTDQSHTLANVAAFAKAWRALDRFVQPVACGGAQ